MHMVNKYIYTYVHTHYVTHILSAFSARICSHRQLALLKFYIFSVFVLYVCMYLMKYLNIIIKIFYRDQEIFSLPRNL